MQHFLDFLADVFGLTAREIQTLIKTIKSAIVTSIQSAYRLWNKVVNGSRGDWEASSGLIKEVEDVVEKTVRGMEDTYQRELLHTASDFLDTWAQEHDGEITGSENALATTIDTWVQGRTAYKAKQIARYETGYGANLGTTQFVTDLVNGGELIDTDTGESIDPSNFAQVVMPEESSGDFCSEYAGQMFALDDDVPDFPAHPNCIHEKIVISLVTGETFDS
jgi:hypothetical protein